MELIRFSILLLLFFSIHSEGNPSLSSPSAFLASTTVGKFVVIGGGSTFDSTTLSSSRIDIYNSDTNTWSLATLSTARYSLSAVSAGRFVLFAGGYDGCNHFFKGGYLG
jgi:hypothetical protein